MNDLHDLMYNLVIQMSSTFLSTRTQRQRLVKIDGIRPRWVSKRDISPVLQQSLEARGLGQLESKSVYHDRCLIQDGKRNILIGGRGSHPMPVIHNRPHNRTDYSTYGDISEVVFLIV